MQNIRINRRKVVFINLTEMDENNGLEANLKGGCSFIEKNGNGHEIFNFRNDNGTCYGYTTPNGKINLPRILNEMIRDALGDYIS